jgi:excisionase family DNA binding protein
MPAAVAKKEDLDLSHWLPKKEVAGILNVSTKSVEKFYQDGKIQGRRWLRPSGRARIMVYHPADVEALRKAREYHPPFMVRTAPPTPASASGLTAYPSSPARVEEMAASFAASIAQAIRAALQEGPKQQPAQGAPPKLLGDGKKKQRPAKPWVEIKDRVYLTVREASAYLGWPQTQVRAAIAAGKLEALGEGYMRVRRRDLDLL